MAHRVNQTVGADTVDRVLQRGFSERYVTLLRSQLRLTIGPDSGKTHTHAKDGR